MISDGELKLDMDDEITSQTMLTRDGKCVNRRVCELLGIGPKQEVTSHG